MRLTLCSTKKHQATKHFQHKHSTKALHSKHKHTVHRKLLNNCEVCARTAGKPNTYPLTAWLCVLLRARAGNIKLQPSTSPLGTCKNNNAIDNKVYYRQYRRLSLLPSIIDIIVDYRYHRHLSLLSSIIDRTIIVLF
jgi:hypothetical protein